MSQEERVPAARAENRMGVAPIGRLLVSMAAPACASMLIMALYNIVDSMYVARIGENALTAVSLAFPLQQFMIALAVGTGVGANSFMSRRLGEKNHQEADSAAAHSMLLAVISGLLFAVIGLLFSGVFVGAYTNDPQIDAWGVQYAQICMVFSIGVFVQMMASRIFQSSGHMMQSTIIQAIGAISNIILDPIFIFGYFGVPAMGVAGAAIATVIGQWISMFASLIMLKRVKTDIHLTFRGFRWNGAIVKQIYAVGFPSIVMQSIGAVLTICFNAILIGFSGAAVSVLGIYFKLQSFVFMPVFGLQQGAMPIFSYNFGARRKDRLMKSFRLTFIASVAIMAIGLAIFWIWPVALLRLFSASDEMLAIGTVALRTVSLAFVFAGAGITVSTFFQSIGHGFKSLIISMLRQLIFILPLGWIFARTLGLNAVWASIPIAELFSILIASVFFFQVYRSAITPLDAIVSDETLAA